MFFNFNPYRRCIPAERPDEDATTKWKPLVEDFEDMTLPQQKQITGNC